MNMKHRMNCILADVARASGIEANTAAFAAHSRSLERWNDRQWNAIGSTDVYFFSIAGRLFDYGALGSAALGDLWRAEELARELVSEYGGQWKSVAKRLRRVMRHEHALLSLA
jgi:hypothetical protein